jgi:hypothetical protein
MGWILLLAGFVLGGCLGSDSTPGGEVKELAGLLLDESRMKAEVDSGRLTFKMVLQRTEERSFHGVLKVNLKDMSGESYDRRETMFSLQEDEKEFSFTLRGIPELDGLEDLAKFLVTYRVEWKDHALFGSRSAYAAAEKMEAQVLAPNRLYEGESTFARVLARDPMTGEAKVGVDVHVELQLEESTVSLGSAATDDTGTAEILLRVPNEIIGQGKMVVSMTSQEGASESVEGSVDVMREEKILLTTDKPIYQPGQLIHMRLLALRRPHLVPCGDEAVLFEVRDGKGNKVFKQRATTNEFGISGADFKLATEVNMGGYEILAKVGTTESIKTVEVKRYALPKFSVSFRPDRGYYLPGERVTGQVEARYFFGKAVSGGDVRVKVFTFDVGLAEIGEVVGQLNDEGIFGFTYDLPTAFAGIDLLQGDAYLQFDVEVTDLAEHTEKASKVSVVAASPLKVGVIPESGDLVPGVGNRIHVVTADPTGMPVSATVTVSGENLAPLTVSTDTRGLGSFVLVPPEDSLVLNLQGQDALGNQMEKEIVLQPGKSGATVLLRVQKRLYRVGDTIHLDVWANDVKDRIYLDVIKGNQTLMTNAIDLTDGQASYEMELTPDMEGNVQFDAYYLTRESHIVRDTQLVLVEGARDLDVSVSMDKEVYLPADTASLTFEVKDLLGQGVAAALGLAIVDEAVFALTEFRPGLAEIFFEIEQDIMKPRYQIINSSALGDYLDPAIPTDEREASAAVVFAAAEGFAGYGIEENTYVDAAREVVTHVKDRIDKDAEGIIEILRTYAGQGLVTQENLALWLEKKQDSWFDPFGQPYRVELTGTYEYDQYLIFHSNGPDELAGSPDDVSSNNYYAWYIYSGYDKGREDGFWDEDLAGDGTGIPGGGPPHGECGGGECGAPDPDDTANQSGGGGERSYFPETLYFNPAVITDDSGRATVEIPLADSITTWRMTSLASSLNGQIGSRADGILVFQDFFVDVDFPATLTRGDEVSVPVAVYNYLDVSQSIDLEMQPEPWFTLQDASSKSITLGPGEVSVVYFTVIVQDVGWHGLTVFGYGSELSDAVRRTVQVVPDGKEFREGRSDRLGEAVTRTVTIPPDAIDDASRLFVKVYPGLMSQAVEGLDAILRIPNGCFEQTTSSAWPNIMVLNYLRESEQLTPEIELKARDYVNQSYQRILTFECPSGGFNWWVGDDPGNAILAAMALMMFSDAELSVDLDMAVKGRTENFLISQQLSDGSWSGESHLHAGNEVFGETALRASAFCTWGLAMSGKTGSALDRGAAYLRSAVGGTDDMYTQALVACALAWTEPNDPALAGLLADLESQKQTGENGVVFWEASSSTASGGYGQNGNVETTAMIVQAMLQAGMYPDLAQGAITWLIQQKDSFGTWRTTQPTVQSLRAMTMAMGLNTGQEVNGTVRISVNGVPDACTFDINPDNSDVTRICELNSWVTEGDNTVTVELDGEGSFLYQAVGVYYLPWAMVSDSPDGPLSLEVTYDRTNLGVDETVTVHVMASYNVPGEKASMIMIDLGIPPGFDLMTEDLAELVQEVPNITRFEKRGRQLSIYVDELSHGTPLTFSYRMKAKYPINGQVPESRVWAYYNPETEAFTKPIQILVDR